VGFETLAGFVLAQLQRIPRRSDSFVYQGRRYTVLEMHDRRVAKVRVEQTALQSPHVQRSGLPAMLVAMLAEAASVASVEFAVAN